MEFIRADLWRNSHGRNDIECFGYTPTRLAASEWSRTLHRGPGCTAYRASSKVGTQSSLGQSFERYELQDDGVTVYFTDGSTATGYLVVGADGGRSAVRNQYIGKEYKLLDPEEICLYGKVLITRGLLARMNPRFQKWMTLCCDVEPLI